MGKKVRRRIFISYQHKDRMKAKDFNLMPWAKNLDVDFWGRHLLDPVDSRDDAYIKSKVREQLKTTSVTVVLIGRDSKKSEYQPWEIEQSLKKDPPNGVVGIKLDGSVSLPPNSDLARMLHDAGAEMIDWDPANFQDAIERAAIAAGRASAIRHGHAGGSKCIR